MTKPAHTAAERAIILRAAASFQEPTAAERAAELPGSAGRFVAVPSLLRSALFSARSGPRRLYPVYEPLATAGGAVIEFAGEELRQQDARVLFALLHAARGCYVAGGCFKIQIESARVFARDALGLGDSGAAAAAFMESLDRLKRASLRITTRNGVAGIGLVSEYCQPRRGAGWVMLSPTIAEALAESVTFIPRTARLELRDGLASWLAGYCCADAGFVEVPALEICRIAGLGKAYEEDRAARRAVRRALEELHAHGLALAHYVNAAGRLCKQRGAVS